MQPKARTGESMWPAHRSTPDKLGQRGEGNSRENGNRREGSESIDWMFPTSRVSAVADGPHGSVGMGGGGGLRGSTDGMYIGNTVTIHEVLSE